MVPTNPLRKPVLRQPWPRPRTAEQVDAGGGRPPPRAFPGRAALARSGSARGNHPRPGPARARTVEPDRLLPSIVNEVGTPRLSLAAFPAGADGRRASPALGGGRRKTDRTQHLGAWPGPGATTMSDVVPMSLRGWSPRSHRTTYRLNLPISFSKFWRALAARLPTVVPTWVCAVPPGPRSPPLVSSAGVGGELVQGAGCRQAS